MESCYLAPMPSFPSCEVSVLVVSFVAAAFTVTVIWYGRDGCAGIHNLTLHRYIQVLMQTEPNRT